MESTYVVLPNENLFRKTHRGIVTVDDEIELVNKILGDPNYRMGMNAVCDFSGASVDSELTSHVSNSRLESVSGQLSFRKERTPQLHGYSLH